MRKAGRCGGATRAIEVVRLQQPLGTSWLGHATVSYPPVQLFLLAIGISAWGEARPCLLAPR